MGFATVMDVERYQPGRAPFGSTTKPTASQVGGICEDVSAELMVDLQAIGFDLTGYPTGVPSLAQRQLQAVTAKISASEVEKVAVNRTADSLKHYQLMADQALMALMASGPASMSPTGQAGSVNFSPSTATGPKFRRDMVL
jgi:hypothetical protein